MLKKLIIKAKPIQTSWKKSFFLHFKSSFD